MNLPLFVIYICTYLAALRIAATSEDFSGMKCPTVCVSPSQHLSASSAI